MLRLIGLIAQATLIALITYNSVTALWGWTNRAPAGPTDRRQRLRVVIPAHNEESVVAGVIGDLKRSDLPADLFQVWLVDDRSTDNTASIALDAGAQLAQRQDGESGKGPALSWYLETHPLDQNEALVVFDADNRLEPRTLSRIADELAAGHPVVQCYLDVTNPDASLLAEASALSYWAGNRMVQLARSNLGWSADLGGTGMAVAAEALEAVGGFTPSLTEDQDLGVRLLLAGYRVEWLHDVRVRDEKPGSLQVAMQQRARWMSGKRESRRRHLLPLLRTGRAACLDMAVRLVQPGRTFVALLSGVLTLLAAITTWDWLLPWQVWAAVTALQVLLPIPFLARDGVDRRRILRYPVLTILAALWLPIRVLSARQVDWYHTPHAGTISGDEPDPFP